ncbi:MAG: hypothetical protein NC212_09500 [Staphylococcus sp.]|nr:hypothetical protein [Staphylococcus sp.]
MAKNKSNPPRTLHECFCANPYRFQRNLDAFIASQLRLINDYSCALTSSSISNRLRAIGAAYNLKADLILRRNELD